MERTGLMERLGGAKDAAAEISIRDTVLRLSQTELFENNGCAEGAIIVIYDVTESERLEQTRREYVANVSHELRTPIASIRGLADALNDGLVRDEGDRARYYGYILKETLRLSRLIDDLLELSRLQSGAMVMEKGRVDLNDLLLDVADRYSALAEEHGMRLSLELPAGALLAWTNPDRAEQVLVALVDNAIKHAAPGGEIRLGARGAGTGELTVWVQNRGEISETDLAHIFDRFYKVDKSHSGNGTGLGLSIAKEILDLMEERIFAESREGMVTFGFTLAEAKPKALGGENEAKA